MQVEVRKRGDEQVGRRSMACLLLGIALLPLEPLLGLPCLCLLLGIALLSPELLLGLACRP